MTLQIMLPLTLGIGLLIVIYSLFEQKRSRPLRHGPRPDFGQQNYQRHTYTNNPDPSKSRGKARKDSPKTQRKPQSSSRTPDTTCTICLGDMVHLKTVPCGHTYHEKCIKPWTDKKPTCPNCRAQTS